MMERGRIYTRKEIQTVWHQHWLDCQSIVWSDDEGKTWNVPFSIDTGKWPLFSMKDGNKVDWVFKLDDNRARMTIKRDCVVLDNKDYPTEKFVKWFNWNKTKPCMLDLREFPFLIQMSNLEITNSSGRNIYLCGNSGVIFTLQTKQKIRVDKGIIYTGPK